MYHFAYQKLCIYLFPRLACHQEIEQYPVLAEGAEAVPISSCSIVSRAQSAFLSSYSTVLGADIVSVSSSNIAS